MEGVEEIESFCVAQALRPNIIEHLKEMNLEFRLLNT